MVHKIIWSPRARASYLGVIDYLEKEWTDKEIKKFTTRVNDKLKTLELQPRIGRAAGKKQNFFRTLVHKKVTLIYHFKPIRKEIELVAFWNHLQNPKQLTHIAARSALFVKRRG